MNHRVGIVVPTLGQRPDYLEQCLRSIRSAGEAHILIVAPASLNTSQLQSAGLIDSVAIDEGGGLPSAINQGMRMLPASIEYVNWLGDDDLLTPGSLRDPTTIMEDKPDVVMVFGACEYIDSRGLVAWKNNSGPWAVTLLRFGPDLIPQPGALFRRSAFNRVGGLRTNLGWAFDFDLFIKFLTVGKLKHLNKTLGQFRWHPESLSVEHRKQSVAEASQVRISHLPSWLKVISFIWELPVQAGTLLAGKRLTAKTQSKARTK